MEIYRTVFGKLKPRSVTKMPACLHFIGQWTVQPGPEAGTGIPARRSRNTLVAAATEASDGFTHGYCSVNDI